MKQYNYKDLERIYIYRISPKCKQQLGEKILEPYPQAMIYEGCTAGHTGWSYDPTDTQPTKGLSK